MEKQLILTSASICWQQLMQTTRTNIIASWGISKKWAVELNGMGALAMKVNGFNFRGWVYAALNRADDLYEIWTSKDLLKDPVKVKGGIFFDALGQELDSIIETDDDGTPEYHAKVDAWLRTII